MPNESHTPLEVPGNRLPETGSRRKLLNVRATLAELKGSRTLRKEVVLKQLRMKRPRIEQKRHLPRSEHLPRFSAEAEKETR
ncbi:hypothetical protein V6N11_067360 [Hibiscus sabdariffa]|uniref:Uncharacterized protein n=1 Tax=Hibiscus sabdariffa TaxID=183260 RepID=A0ABR2SQU7_9ROSI